MYNVVPANDCRSLTAYIYSSTAFTDRIHMHSMQCIPQDPCTKYCLLIASVAQAPHACMPAEVSERNLRGWVPADAEGEHAHSAEKVACEPLIAGALVLIATDCLLIAY